MREEIKKLLFYSAENCSYLHHYCNYLDRYQGITKEVIFKNKSNDNFYLAKKFGIFTGYLLTILLIAVIYSDNLRVISVARGVAEQVLHLLCRE
ncbi:MAG: hypothetical protein ABI288_03890 [Ginsengibacter sp.]